MGVCKFVDELNKLRKSSSYSIDGVENFDYYKKYMHVSRRVEEDLIETINKVNNSKRKTLVLLCGSAGDGKSHLLSYLKNEVKILGNYTVYNDATESSAPSKTAIETLHDALSDFSDENIDSPGKNFILAINLGVLSNFIESSYGSDFTKLYEYVVRKNILTNELNTDGYEENSPFQHVNFSDYHMYTLTETGVKPVYLEQIFEKIFRTDVENPFYEVYEKECMKCPLSEKCTVKHNFEFLSSNSNRSYIAQALVEITIKDKEILTTREILNFIYDIMVARTFNCKKLAQLSTNENSFLKEYVRNITPSLLYEYSDVSIILDKMRKYDPLLIRSEIADEDAIFYYVSSDVKERIINSIGKEAYSKVLCQKSAIFKINDDKMLKAQIFNILVRINAMKRKRDKEGVYSKFLEALFYFNIGKTKKFGELYGLVEDAIIQWCGSETNDSICFEDWHKEIALYEYIEFEPYLCDYPDREDLKELQRFLPFITVKYENKKTREIISLDIDYSLYELIYKLASGYIQTAEDRNNHADFISFVQKILKTGSADKELMLVTEDNRKAVIEKTKFGVYKFKVVK